MENIKISIENKEKDTDKCAQKTQKWTQSNMIGLKLFRK